MVSSTQNREGYGFEYLGKLNFSDDSFSYKNTTYKYANIEHIQFTAVATKHTVNFIPAGTSHETYLSLVMANGKKLRIKQEKKFLISSWGDKERSEAVMHAFSIFSEITFNQRIEKYEQQLRDKGFANWGKFQIKKNGDLLKNNVFKLNLKSPDILCRLGVFQLSCELKNPGFQDKIKGFWSDGIAIIDISVDKDCFLYVMKNHLGMSWSAQPAPEKKQSSRRVVQETFKSMEALDVQIIDGRLGDNSEGPKLKSIQVIGLFPVTSTRNVAFVTSIFDRTVDKQGVEKMLPVLSAIERYQEPKSVVFQTTTEIGQVSGDQGFRAWARIGTVFPEILTPPKTGPRTLVAILRLIDLAHPPTITGGFCVSDQPGLLWQRELEFSHTFTVKGYLEAAEDREKAKVYSIRIAMAVAMSDGSLDDTEGEIFNSWIKKAIDPYDGKKRNHLKELYNNALRASYNAAHLGELILSDLTAQLQEISDVSERYETVQLCFDVMAADGIADSEELKIINKVAEALEIDFDEFENMRDKKLVSLNVNLDSQASIEEIIGIGEDWSSDRIKRYLRTEFQKWNDRLNTLSEGEERDNAQRMLDLIADARKKYE